MFLIADGSSSNKGIGIVLKYLMVFGLCPKTECRIREPRGNLYCKVCLVQKRPNWRITYLLYYLFDYEYVYIHRLAIICCIAHKILVAIVTTFENTSLATAKLAIF